MIRERRGRCKAEALHRARAAAEAQHIKETFNEKGLKQSATKSQPPPSKSNPGWQSERRQGTDNEKSAEMKAVALHS